jgi:hypothetical protein
LVLGWKRKGDRSLRREQLLFAQLELGVQQQSRTARVF